MVRHNFKVLHFLDERRNRCAKAKQLVLPGLSLDSQREVLFCLYSQKLAFRLQRIINPQHIKLCHHFNVAAVLDVELEEKFIFKLLQLVSLFRQHLDKLVQQREYVKAFQDIAVERITVQALLYLV